MQGGWAHYPHLKSASRGGLARSSSLEGTSGEDAAANERRAETNRRALPSVYPLVSPTGFFRGARSPGTLASAPLRTSPAKCRAANGASGPAALLRPPEHPAATASGLSLLTGCAFSLRGRWRSATPSSALPEGTHRLNLADDHLRVTGVPFSIVSNTNADTSTRSFLDDPADRELRASRIDRELHAKPSSALRCPHTFPRAATPVGTRALPIRRR